ncbi:hypothetical protein FG386_001606 [Cryptosporidium ryanae]|uniref:uncharacterized protein n=1 Tax=Cryptosporidium ryanae TaxID=515981 RepID=UPI00351A4D20|nr:hypothetical protein FG386_001606 [Cryptosporidium ryanae]
MEFLKSRKDSEPSQLKKYNSRRISSEINKFLSKKYIRNEYEYSNSFLYSDMNLNVKNTREINSIVTNPMWYRDTCNENILDICFKKPIYSGNSKFNYLPKAVDDNLEWFKRTKNDFIEENEVGYVLSQKEIFFEKKKQHIMAKSQENSRYRYISPFSEYLLERLNWKVALRIYYTLDPERKGFIELSTLKNKLLAMLRVDTEKAQVLLMFIESITPFFVKEGCIHKDEIVTFIAKQVSDESITCGLFSKLRTIFMSPIGRSKKFYDKKNNAFIQRGYFTKPEAFNGNKFKLNPENIVLKLSEINVYNAYGDYFSGFCNFNKYKEQSNCLYKYGFCRTNKAKYSVKGNLQDHINIGKERKQKLVDKIKDENIKSKIESELECTFKPKITWPLEKYMRDVSNKNWNIKDYSRKMMNKKEINIMGYIVINEENSKDSNILSSLNSLVYPNDFDHKHSLNEYIFDHLNNQIYVFHKGFRFDLKKNEDYPFDDISIDKNRVESDKRLQLIAERFVNEFLEIDKKYINEKNNSKNVNNKIKLIDKLRAGRKNSFYDPRFKNMEYELDNKPMEFKEKIVNIDKLPTYKEVINHNIKPKSENLETQSYYYLPKGYEQIINCYNEWKIRRKMIPDNLNMRNCSKDSASIKSYISNIKKDKDRLNNTNCNLKENISEFNVEESRLESISKVNLIQVEKNMSIDLRKSSNIDKSNKIIKSININPNHIEVNNSNPQICDIDIPKFNSASGVNNIEQNYINGSSILNSNKTNYTSLTQNTINDNNLSLKTSNGLLSHSSDTNELGSKLIDNHIVMKAKNELNMIKKSCKYGKVISKKSLNLKTPLKKGECLIKKTENCFLKNSEQIEINAHTNKEFEFSRKKSIQVTSNEIKNNYSCKLTSKGTDNTTQNPKKSCIVKTSSETSKSNILKVFQKKSNIQNQVEPKKDIYNIKKYNNLKFSKDIDNKPAKFVPKKNSPVMKKQIPIVKITKNISKNDQINSLKIGVISNHK